jgi:hypothetical protein
MKNYIRTTFLAALLLASVSVYGAQINLGVRMGPPPQPRVVRTVPRSPGSDYVRVDGYWYPVGNHYKWHDGYWTRAPYAGARWVAPQYDGTQYFQGYWEGDQGRLEHNHKSDHNRNRDFRR